MTRTANARQSLASIGSALLMLLIGSLQTDTSLAADRPDFSGSWQLNEELSENPRDKMMEKRGGGRARGGSGGGGGMRGGGAGGNRDGASPEDMQARFEAMIERIETLKILHQDPELVIGFADDSSRRVYTDGRAAPDDLEAGVFEGRGKWQNNSQVVFKSESARGGKVTEIYELDEAGDMLFVTTKMEGDGRRPSISFRRVYDRILVETPSAGDRTELDS